MRSGIGVRDRPGRYPRARKGETMSVSIATITAVLIVGHIVVFLLLLFDTRQGVVTGYDRAFLWGKALQIAGWGLMMGASSTGLVILFCAGNATLVCGWSLEIFAMLSLKVVMNRAYTAGYVLLPTGSVIALLVPGLAVGTRIMTLFLLQTVTYLIPGAILMFSRRDTSLIQKVTGAIYLLCSMSTLYRVVAILQDSAYAAFPGASSSQGVAFALLLQPFLLLLSSMSYVLLKKEQLNRRLQVFAETDPLTGLSNRRAFFRLAGEHVLRSAARNEPLSLLMIDIDKFKAINDTHGHAAGDDIIANLAATLRESIRQSDIACRFGGEEFVVLLAGCDGREAFRIAERIRAAAERSEPRSIRYTISIGVATERGDGTNLDALIQRADDRMYRAKELGRNRVVQEE